MKKIIMIALFALAIVSTQAQTKVPANAQLTCTEIGFWLKQLETSFKGIPTTVVDETELTSTRKINGFDTCTIRKDGKYTLRYADGYSIFKDLKGAKMYYDKVSRTAIACLKTKQYSINPVEVKGNSHYFQVANKPYGTRGGYYQIIIELKERYDAEGQVSNGKDGYDVSIVLELHTEGPNK